MSHNSSTWTVARRRAPPFTLAADVGSPRGDGGGGRRQRGEPT